VKRIIAAAALAVIGCQGPRTSVSKTHLPVSSVTLEECTVLEIAERFVLENGYTSTPITVDPSKLVWALGDDPSRVQQVIRSRFDTLNSHAYGLQRGVPDDPDAWTVVFEYTDRIRALMASAERRPLENSQGIVVKVKLGPDRPIVVTQDTPILLSAVKPLPPEVDVTTSCSALIPNRKATASPVLASPIR
jgi:hypothetical protein